MNPLSFNWQARDNPLRPQAVLAIDKAAKRLAIRLQKLNDDELAQLRGAGNSELLLILGPADRLPWVDGVQYFGTDPLAPSLYLPCQSRPTIELSLVHQAFLKLTKRERYLVYPERKWMIPTGQARPLDRQTLQSWRQGN